MIGYFLIRLGADSEKEIRQIDSIQSYSADPFSIAVSCKQVPKGVSPGDVAVIWLGTNNNKGGKTPWIQGVRALGRIEKISGVGGYSAAKTVRLSLGVVLPRSITKMDIVTKQSRRYPDIAGMPVLGVNNYSSQVVQRIDPSESGQSLRSLFAALDGILPGMKSKTLAVYPDLMEFFLDRTMPGFSPSLPSHELEEEDDAALLTNSAKSSREIDDDGLEPDDDRDSEIEVPFDPSKIDIIAKPMTISSLEDRLDNNELDLTPDFQRQANVWDVKRKARLIESILLRIPLPSFYFSEDLDGGYAVVDGLQRLCAVFHFKNPTLLNSTTGANLGQLKLKGLQYLKELEGSTFADLDRKFQRRISELEITANIIRANTPSAVKFNVFARLNQGGMPLNAQEIRNAIFPGEWRNELRKLAESKEFVDATDGKVRTSRQQDMELVLRFVAIWQIGAPYFRPSNQTLDEFLNTTVENVLCKWDSRKWEEASDAFYHAIDAAGRVRGKHAFRKSANTQQRKPINRGLFEAEMIVYGSLNAKALSQAEKSKKYLGKLFLSALAENKDFTQSLLYGTGSPESSNARIAVLNRIVAEAINA
ncbi:DUF262 domain-containing protein [Niveibacterium microcysteis]|uniref:DUF262 domain-containing protein n=1 Tax=Niveibacterium microcysteis TaxID=2811415 RepID=A0ABX7MA35_9RHOO|nr:DUF262 domain-containing protein [Niveibacterium microcysteis]QSI76352.1 DUF262 domain-containing protein [Niveibacterium microcysteis]